jgi:hypothetical protein
MSIQIPNKSVRLSIAISALGTKLELECRFFRFFLPKCLRVAIQYQSLLKSHFYVEWKYDMGLVLERLLPE